MEYFVALLRNVFVVPDRRQSISSSQECANEIALYKRVEEKENIVAFLQESVHFSRMVSEAVPLINALLMSKQAGDVSEAIDFFTTAHHFNIESAKDGVANMLLLVWSPDQVSVIEKLFYLIKHSPLLLQSTSHDLLGLNCCRGRKKQSVYCYLVNISVFPCIFSKISHFQTGKILVSWIFTYCMLNIN